MLTCSHCKQPLNEADVSRQTCPHCGGRVLSGQGTIDSDRGHLTIDSDRGQLTIDSDRGQLTIDSDRGQLTIDSDRGQLTIELPPPVPPRDSTVAAKGAATIVSDPRHSSTIDSADLAAASADPRHSNTIDSSDLPPDDPKLSRTIEHDSGSVSQGDSSQTLDSISGPGQSGSGSAPVAHRASQAGQASGDDVDNRLRQVWGSQMVSSKPHMTMRGSESGEEREERSTLIIRERAVRQPTDAAPPTMPDYDLLNVLGEGGMGVVYNARQASIDREVAVKMLKADMAASPAQRRKFLSEAAVTGELDHPNIVPIYDLGQNADGALFYSMKKVVGTPWADVIGQKLLLDNLTILMKVADAVAFAHARGVVHRDLKPENVMLGDFGEVLVLDWGLAVATDGHRPTPNVSAAFNIAGTPAYMAPELAFGPMEAIGRHSDIYLLGAILYECITGRPPHAGKSARDCLKAAARNQIVPTEKRGELVDIARQAMDTEPARRHATVQAFQAAIREYQAHSESIVLCERAEEGLLQAARTNDYQDYARALFAFEEALQLWPGYEHAKTGASRARLHYATCALGKSDFDLGLSLLDLQDPTHAPLLAQLREAKAERDARQQRLKRARRMMAGLAALVFVAVSVGVVVASYLAYVAKESEGRAKASAIKAETNAGIATREAERAGKAETQAVASAYTALIAMAAARIDENAFDQARQALEQCDGKLRGWEWRRLMYVVEQGDVTQWAVPSRAECLAASASGNLLATGSLDGVVRLWDRQQRTLVAERNLGQGAARITALAFHPQDDRWVVVGLSDGPQPLVAWNRESGELRSPSPAGDQRHTGGVVQATFAADGKSLITASHDRTARLWNWETLTSREFAGHTATVWSAALSADGKALATASEDGTVRIWDAATGQQLQSASGQRIPFAEHQGPVHAVVFLPDPSATETGPQAQPTEPRYFLASAGYDKRVLLWQTDQLVPFDFQGLVGNRPVEAPRYQELKGHTAAVRSLDVSSDGSRLVSAATDHTIRVWQVQDSPFARRGTLVKELRGHAGPVYAAVFAKGDANAVVSTGYDARVRLWSIDQYHEQQTMPGLALRGHLNAVLSARFSRGGESIVTASLDRTAKRWNAKTAALEQSFREGHAYLASRAIFFPKSRRLLTAGGDGTVRIWDLDKQAELRVLDRTGYRAAAAIAPDERWILTGSSEVLADSNWPHGAIVWDAETGKQVHPLVGPHKAPVTCVAFCPAAERSLALTGDDNGVFQLWEPQTAKPIGPRIDQHGSPLIAAEFSQDGQSLITADAGGQVFRWDVTDLTAIAKVREYSHPAGVQSIGLAPDGRHLLTGGADGRLRLFDESSQEPIWMADSLASKPSLFVSAQSPATESISAVSIGWDKAKGVAVAVAIDSLRRGEGALAAVGGDEEYVRLFELDFGQRAFRELSPAAGAEEPYLLNLQEHGAVGWSAAISSDGGQIATVGRDEARLWDREGNELAGFRPHQDLTFAEFSHAGDLVVTASLDSSVRVWDAASGQARLTLDQHSAGPLVGHRKPVTCAVFSADDKQVLTGSEDGTVRVWDLATMRVVQEISVDSQGVTRLVISSDGSLLFTASRSGQAAIWRLADPAQPVHKLAGHTGEILDLCLSSDQKWIATASADNTARIWNTATGAEVLKLVGHSSEVTAVAMLADSTGMRVLTGSSDQTARLWAVSGLTAPAGGAEAAASRPEAKELLSLRGHTRGLTSVAFAPDGRAALTAARDGMTILWPAIQPGSP